MHRLLSRAAARWPALAGAVLLAGGCTTGVNVGQDGQGGGTTTTATNTGGGDGVPTGNACKSPGALLCPWGESGGPCGGNRPNKKDCQDGLVCVGGSADTEGTCAPSAGALVGPGDACGTDDSGTPVCPWSYECRAPTGSGGGARTCVPRNCALGDGSPLVSAASITVDGDGPTRHYDFACTIWWGTDLTGEAGAYTTHLEKPPSIEWLHVGGCQSPDGDPYQGSLLLVAPLTTVGTVTDGEVSYSPANTGNYVNTPSDGMTFTVTEIGADLVRGSYDVVVQGGVPPETKHLSGTFDVCRLPYHYPP